MTLIRASLILILALFCNGMWAQNVGIGTTLPTAKLDVNGNLRVRTLPDATTLTGYDSVLVADVNGNVAKAPFASGGRIYFGQASTTTSLTVTSGSGPTATLAAVTFTPQNDTVLATVSVAGTLTAASSMPASPAQQWATRLFLGGTQIKLTYPHVSVNTVSGGVGTGRLVVSYTVPVAVVPGVPQTLSIQMAGLFTVSGSQTLRIDPAQTPDHAVLTVYDFPTN